MTIITKLQSESAMGQYAYHRIARHDEYTAVHDAIVADVKSGATPEQIERTWRKARPFIDDEKLKMIRLAAEWLHSQKDSA